MAIFSKTHDDNPFGFNFGDCSVNDTITITNGAISCDQKDKFSSYIKDAVNEAIYGSKKVCGGSAELKVAKKSGWLPETKTRLFVEKGAVKCRYYDGVSVKSSLPIIPDIESIEVIKERVVKVHFCDGATEKAVLKGDDVYSYEYGVTICLMKKILSDLTGGNGGSVYNKLVTYAIKQNQMRLDSIAESEKKEKEAKAAAKAYEDRIRLSKIKADQRAREREIEIQKEAYLRAMKEFSTEQIEKFGMELSTTIESTEDTPEIAKEDNTEN